MPSDRLPRAQNQASAIRLNRPASELPMPVRELADTLAEMAWRQLRTQETAAITAREDSHA